METACRICASPATLHLIGKKKQPYHFCPVCDYIFKDPGLYAGPGLEKKRYLEHHNSPDNAGYVELLMHFYTAAVAPFTVKTGRLLDYGSGPEPVFACLLEKAGWAVDLYDPYFAPREILPGQKYNAITLVEVFEHIKEPGAVFRKLQEHLTHQGIIAVMTRFHPQNKDKLESWWYRQDLTHVGFFSVVTMQHLADRYNLEIVYINNKDICTFKSRE